MGGRRGREGGRHPREPPPRSSPRVSGTGDSSAASKRSAAALGYTSDRFVLQLLPRGGPRRTPAIHRGYHVRAQAVERSLRAFLTGPRGHPRRQVLSLGAGWDSLFFCLKEAALLAGSGGRFFEVDLPEVASRKAALIAGSAELSALAGEGGGVREGPGSLKYSGDDYRLLGVDLSRLAQLEGALRGAGLDPAAPTLILAEVVLPYMEVERSDALIQWAAGHFLKAWFILYEQIHPSDPFGRIMQNHFSRLQSPLRSLTSYPDCKAQQMRFLQRGWTECHIMDMNEFYRSFVPGEEQKRIQALEPFDEFEEWHLKCSHYFILAASKGEDSSAPPVFPRMEAPPAHHATCFAGTVAASFCGAVAGLKRYGHCSVLFAPDVILTTGGFGDHGGRHCRLTELHILLKQQDGWRSDKVRLAELEMSWDGRLFHTVNVLRSGWAVVLGGRKSPVNLALPPLHLKGLADADPLNPSNPVLELTPLPPVEGLSVPCWRHTATEVKHEGQAYLFIYGGCSSGQLVLTDWHFLHLEELRCQQIPVEGPVPAGRHSHSACSWAGGVLIAGGLAASEKPLGSLLFLKPAGRGFRWHSLETCPPLIPRYSHTAHVHRGKLLLVGGVWLSPPSVPGVAVIDLVTRALAEYHIDTTFLEWPLMLHNHSSVIVPDTEEMILTGGGGNCFSFGTHLNWSPIRLDLSSI